MGRERAKDAHILSTRWWASLRTIPPPPAFLVDRDIAAAIARVTILLQLALVVFGLEEWWEGVEGSSARWLCCSWASDSAAMLWSSCCCSPLWLLHVWMLAVFFGELSLVMFCKWVDIREEGFMWDPVLAFTERIIPIVNNNTSNWNRKVDKLLDCTKSLDIVMLSESFVLVISSLSFVNLNLRLLVLELFRVFFRLAVCFRRNNLWSDLLT